MADILHNNNAPIIPVIDERLSYLPCAPREHKARIDEYNELLEVVYQREVEISGIKMTLAGMREMIAREARLLDASAGASSTSTAAVKSDSESDVDAEHVLSDESSDKAKPARKVAKKDKKPKGSRRSRVPDAQLDGDWDYKLDLASLGAATRRARRQSDASDDSEPALI